MSILNAWTSKTRALVAVDTAGGLEDGSTLEMQKLYYLSHRNLILAARGPIGVAYSFNTMLGSEDYKSFDHACDMWPEISARAQPMIQSIAERDSRPLAYQIALVGWSDRAARFAILSEAHAEGSNPSPQLLSSVRSPDDQLGADEQKEPSVSQLINLMKRQVSVGLALQPGCFGGRMITAELTREAAYFKSRPL